MVTPNDHRTCGAGWNVKISNGTTTVIARMRGWRGARRNLARTQAAHGRASVRIAGSRIVVGSITRRWRRDVSVRRMRPGKSEPGEVSTDGTPSGTQSLSEPWWGYGVGAGRITAMRVRSGVFAARFGNSPATGSFITRFEP